MKQSMKRVVINDAVEAADFLRDFGRPLANAAGDIGIDRLSLECVPQNGVAVGLLLKIDAAVGMFRRHTVIFY